LRKCDTIGAICAIQSWWDGGREPQQSRWSTSKAKVEIAAFFVVALLARLSRLPCLSSQTSFLTFESFA
jgi:hypothetical protein